MNGFATLILLLALTFAAGGCATVRPPARPPADPVYAYLTDYGIHSSVVLPVDDDGFYVEYAFGDFGYAALNNDGIFDALGALFLSFKSGFGKQYLRVPPGETQPVLMYLPKTMQRFVVSREKVDLALAKLDARWNRDPSPPVHNELTHIDWKVDDTHYSALNNCNTLTATQLTELGYPVSGWKLSSGYKVPGATTVRPQAVKDPSKQPGGLSGSR